MYNDSNELIDDGDVFIDVPVSWLAVKTNNIEAVANALDLQNTRMGNYSEWGYGNPPNTFLYVANEWVIVHYSWEDRGQLDPIATNEDCARSVYAANVALLDRLSEQFGESQAFGFEENHIFYALWALSKNGKIERYFYQSGEEIKPGSTINIGNPTAAEDFINWDTLNDWELVEADEDESYYEYNGDSFGCAEVLRIARQWSFNPITNQQERDPLGMLGDGCISLV